MTDPIKQMYVLDAQATELPRAVYDEVRELWLDNELGNDYCYYTWTEHDFHAADDATEGKDSIYNHGWPAIAAYLRSRGIEQCLIHFWW